MRKRTEEKQQRQMCEMEKIKPQIGDRTIWSTVPRVALKEMHILSVQRSAICS